MAGASKPLTVDTKQQRIARPGRGGPCAVPWRAHDMRSRMPERARWDLWEPRGQSPGATLPCRFSQVGALAMLSPSSSRAGRARGPAAKVVG